MHDDQTDSAPEILGMTRILLVEDEQVVRDMIKLALERLGYRVTAVALAEAALNYLERPDVDIDLLLSDVVLPGLDGPALLEEVRRTRPGLPAIFISGYTAAAPERRPVPDDVPLLEKPFTGARLGETIRAVLAESRRPG